MANNSFERDTGYADCQLGLYSALFGVPLLSSNPIYLARRKRNIENNQTSIYEDIMQSGQIKVKDDVDGPTIKILTKDDYMRVVKDRRKTFVHAHFHEMLTELFVLLADDAEKSKVCHREVIFDLPEHFDLEKTERILCEYFADCGYKPLPEPRKPDQARITITLT